MEEIWKDIENYEGSYQVSDNGRIRSLDRSLIDKNGKKYFRHGKIMAQSINSSGYYITVLYRNNIKETIYYHIIIAKTFILNPMNKPEVNHKDGIKTNILPENLEWCTTKENSIHAWANGLQLPTCGISGSDNKRSLSVIQSDLSGNFISSFGSIREASRLTGTPITTIRYIASGKNKNPKYFNWKYVM